MGNESCIPNPLGYLSAVSRDYRESCRNGKSRLDVKTGPTFGAWLWAAAIVTAGIAMLDQYDRRLAMLAAIMILMAAFFRYPAALNELLRILGWKSSMLPNATT